MPLAIYIAAHCYRAADAGMLIVRSMMMLGAELIWSLSSYYAKVPFRTFNGTCVPRAASPDGVCTRQAKNLRDRLGASLRDVAPAPADLVTPPSMWDLLSAIEHAEHEKMLRTQAETWAATHPKSKRAPS